MPTVKALGLYDLLAPQYLLGLRGALDKLKLPFAEHIDKYLSMLAVRDLQTTSDPNAVLPRLALREVRPIRKPTFRTLCPERGWLFTLGFSWLLTDSRTDRLK